MQLFLLHMLYSVFFLLNML